MLSFYCDYLNCLNYVKLLKAKYRLPDAECHCAMSLSFLVNVFAHLGPQDALVMFYKAQHLERAHSIAKRADVFLRGCPNAEISYPSEGI